MHHTRVILVVSICLIQTLQAIKNMPCCAQFNTSQLIHHFLRFIKEEKTSVATATNTLNEMVLIIYKLKELATENKTTIDKSHQFFIDLEGLINKLNKTIALNKHNIILLNQSLHTNLTRIANDDTYWWSRMDCLCNNNNNNNNNI